MIGSPHLLFPTRPTWNCSSPEVGQNLVGTLYDAAQFEHDNNKKDENESVVVQSQIVTFIQNQNQKFHHLRAQEGSQFLSSLILNTILLLFKKSLGLEEPRVKLK